MTKFYTFFLLFVRDRKSTSTAPYLSASRTWRAERCWSALVAPSARRPSGSDRFQSTPTAAFPVRPCSAIAGMPAAGSLTDSSCRTDPNGSSGTMSAERGRCRSLDRTPGGTTRCRVLPELPSARLACPS